MNITRPATFSRRTFLRGAGVSLALPLLVEAKDARTRRLRGDGVQ